MRDLLSSHTSKQGGNSGAPDQRDLETNPKNKEKRKLSLSEMLQSTTDRNFKRPSERPDRTNE